MRNKLGTDWHESRIVWAEPAPNQALEPTPTASARPSLRLLARLTAGVRRLRKTQEGAKMKNCGTHISRCKNNSL